MHRSYRFDISPHLRGRPLDLEVDLHSATAYAKAERQRLGDRPRAYSAPYNFVRKMACSFGWDWGPDLRTAGLWKPVRLERWSVARLAQVEPLVTVDDAGIGRVELRIDLERLDSETPLTLTADILGHRVGARWRRRASAIACRRGARRADLVARRLRRAAAGRPHAHVVRRRPGTRSVAATGRFPNRRTGHGPRRDRRRIHVCRQRSTGVRQRRQLDPR